MAELAERDTSLSQLETFLLLFNFLNFYDEKLKGIVFKDFDSRCGGKDLMYMGLGVRYYLRESVDVSGKDTELRGDFGSSGEIQKTQLRFLENRQTVYD